MPNNMVTNQELEKGLIKLKNRKAVGVDGIITDIIKAGGRPMERDAA